MAMKGPRKAEITCEYQNYIEHAPMHPKVMHKNACSNDGVTIETWRDIWTNNVKANKAHFKSFADHGVGKLWGINKNKPAVIVGSGPSLNYNGHVLKDRGDILAISCLHNYHFFEDRGVKIDYYVSLDAGEVVLEEVSEGGSKSAEEYWESTRDKTLLAYVGSHPDLFKKWKGKIYLFNAPVPDVAFMNSLESIEKFSSYVGNGGNVLGACLYIAKAVMGSNPIAFVGADFSFGYDKKFHGWDSKYDKKMGQVMRSHDVFGNKVLTWPSYHGFKQWFEYVCLTVPGLYVNCTEGGTLGAYPDGNIMDIRQMPLHSFIEMYEMHNQVKVCFTNPEVDEKRLLF